MIVCCGFRQTCLLSSCLGKTHQNKETGWDKGGTNNSGTLFGIPVIEQRTVGYSRNLLDDADIILRVLYLRAQIKWLDVQLLSLRQTWWMRVMDFLVTCRLFIWTFWGYSNFILASSSRFWLELLLLVLATLTGCVATCSLVITADDILNAIWQRCDEHGIILSKKMLVCTIVCQRGCYLA